eukprot:942633-Prorocentrum_lima.AAC.1
MPQVGTRTDQAFFCCAMRPPEYKTIPERSLQQVVLNVCFKTIDLCLIITERCGPWSSERLQGSLPFN